MAGLLVGLAGCGGVRLEDGRYVVARKGYRVGVPVGWTRIESEADLALRREDRSAGLMAQANGRAKVLAGGTDILVQLREGLRDAELVVDIKKIPELMELSFSSRSGSRLR